MTTTTTRGTTATTEDTAAETTTGTSPGPFRDGRPGFGAAIPSAGDLFVAHSRMVFGLCRLLLRDPVEAEDATQQVFLAAHRSVTGGLAPRDPAPWLAAIARNECRARIRARSRAPSELPLLPESLPDPVAAAVLTADLDALWRALAALPRRQRKAFLLREVGGLSYRELGVALGVTQPAVESLLFRARKRLRDALTIAGTAAVPAPVRDQLVRLLPTFGASSPGTATAKCAAVAVGLGLGAAGVAELPEHHAHPRRLHSSAPDVVKHGARPGPERHAASLAVVRGPVALVTRQKSRSGRDGPGRRGPAHGARELGQEVRAQEAEVDAEPQAAPAGDDAARTVAPRQEQPQRQRDHLEQPQELEAVPAVTQDASGDDMTNHGDQGGGSGKDGSSDGSGGGSGGSGDHAGGGD